jgi:hypothetical protein
VSVTERGDDPRWLLLEGYDHHQPPTWAYVLLEEALATGAFILFAMVRRDDRSEERVEIGRQFSVTRFRVEDVVAPGVLEQDDPDAVRRRRFGENGPIVHENARSTASASWSLG